MVLIIANNRKFGYRDQSRIPTSFSSLMFENIRIIAIQKFKFSKSSLDILHLF